MERWQARRVDSVKREGVRFDAPTCGCCSFSVEVKREKDRAGDKLRFDYALAFRYGATAGARRGDGGTRGPCLPFIRPPLIALLQPDIVFPVPVDQRAGCLALTHEKRVSAQMWEAFFTAFERHTVFGINLPRIHPLEVVTTITDGSSSTKNCCLLRLAMNDRNPELAGRTLLH